MLNGDEIKKLADTLRPFYAEFLKGADDKSRAVTWLMFQDECEGLPDVDIGKIAERL